MPNKPPTFLDLLRELKEDYPWQFYLLVFGVSLTVAGVWLLFKSF